MKKLRVSVIIPTKNSGRTIEACLASIKNQTYSPLEIIVVDNKSSDNTPKVSRKYADHVFTQGPERSAQRNYGAKKARGEMLFFIDSDMVLSERVVEECVKKLVNKNLHAVVVPEQSIGEGFWSRCKAFERSCYVGVEWMEGARFFRTKTFWSLGGYDLNNTGTEDFDLPQRLRAKFGHGAISRINSFIFHDEGRHQLWSLLKKKFYYAQKLGQYTSKEENAAPFSAQTSIFARYKLFFEHSDVLFKEPLVWLGTFFLKTSEFIAGGSGLLYAKMRRS